MAYSDFTLALACQAFSLDLQDEVDLTSAIPPVRVSPLLRGVLDEYFPMATAINTEKARSEFIIAPILGEVRRLMRHAISLFSGTEFNVDSAKGLIGTCDFILGASRTQMFLRSPIVMIVEAKNENFKAGMGQCAAEMVAARLFNERQQEGSTTIHGAVTTGSLWKFLKLEGPLLSIDRSEYHVDLVEKVLGILLQCVGGDPATAGAAA